MTIWLLFKLLVVIVFLLAFLRRPHVTWGVGLLTVTTAVLLDTLLGTFGPEQSRAQLGFFFYVFSGALFSGSAIWLWGVLRPYTASYSGQDRVTAVGQPTSASSSNPINLPPVKNIDSQVGTAYSQSATGINQSTTASDRQMLYDEIRQRFGRTDVLDLMFDLGINENDVVTINQDMHQLIRNIMDYADEHNLTGSLALAVERILTPPPPEHLPRLEKIDVDSPPTVLRQFLLAHYSLAQLQRLSQILTIDWEQLAEGNKKEKVRSLLQYLYRRNRIHDLINLLHESIPSKQ